MTESKLEAIALIERIPDEKSATVLKILQNVCELLSVDTNLNEHLTARIEQNLALMEELENLIGEDGAVARLGGDNYISVFRDELKGQVLDAFKGVPIVYDMIAGKRVMVSACAGVFDIPDNFSPDNPMIIMDRIYPAMMVAKQEDHGTIINYDENMEKMSKNVNHIRDIFPEALDRE